MKLFLFVVLAVFNSANSFATPDFEKDAMMVQYISEGVSSAGRDSKILESLGTGLKNTNDKMKLKDIISKFRVKQNRPTYIPFLNQLRVEIPGTSSFISFESNSKKAHSILVNGHIEIVFDPDNIWNSIADSSKKTTWFNLILPQANASDGIKPSNTDLISTAIFLMSIGKQTNREIVDTYFKSREKTPFSKAGELRAICVGEDKAKTFNPKQKLQIEDVGDGYKISSQGAKAFFKIVPVSNGLSSEVFSKCVSMINYKQFRDRSRSNSASDHGILKVFQFGDDVYGREIEDLVEYAERNPLDRKSVKTADALQDIYLQCFSKLKISIQRCEGESCQASDWASLKGEFDPIWFEKYKEKEKKSKEKIIDAEKIVKNPQESGENIAKADHRISAAQKEVEDNRKPIHVLSNEILTDVVNLNAFSKCCGDNKCKQMIYDTYKLNIKHETPQGIK